MQINVTKFAAQMLVIICSTVLYGMGRMDGTAWIAINGPLIGYITGNGNSAFQGSVSHPVISPSAERVEAKAKDNISND